MKSTRILLVLALLGTMAAGTLALTGCSDKDTAAKVNGEAISNEQLDQQLAQLKKQYPNMFEGADGEGRLLDFKQRLLDNLVNAKLIEQAAKDKDIKISDAEVKKQIDQLKAGYKDDTQFEDALKSAGMTVASLTEQIRQQLMTQKLIESLTKNEKVSAADVKTYYNANKSQFFQKASKRPSHILFKVEDKKKAAAILAKVQAGDDFAALAKANSIDTATAAKGGDLGWPTVAYAPEFQAALDKLKKGQTSGLVQTPYGWHIIRITAERSGSQQSLEEVKAQIEQIIIQQRRADAYQKFLNNLRKKADIEVLVEDLKSSKASNATTATK